MRVKLIMNRIRWNWAAAGAVATLGLVLGGLTVLPAAAQLPPAPTPAPPTLPGSGLEPGPALSPPGIRWQGCEDPAARRIDFALLSRYNRFEGRVRITGVVKNVGTAAFVSGAGQQVVLLYEDRRVVARAPFQRLAVGQEVRVTFDRPWYAGVEFPPTYELVISYDPDIYLDGNPDNDDCKSSNNSLSRRGGGLSDLFP